MFSKLIRGAVALCKKIAAPIGAGAMVLASTAHAELPAAVATGVAEMQSDFTDMFTLFFPVLVVIVGSFLAWRYFKKMGNKV